MAKVKKNAHIEMTIEQGLETELGPDGVQRIVSNIYQEAGRFLVGRGSGRANFGLSPIDRHFAKTNEQRYGFAPLSPQYAKWKKKHFGNKPILVRTGAWKQSATNSTVVSTPDGATVAPSNPPAYAKYLEKGTKKMPARPAFTINEEDENDLDNFLNRFAQEFLNERITLGLKKQVV